MSEGLGSFLFTKLLLQKIDIVQYKQSAVVSDPTIACVIDPVYFNSVKKY